MLASPATWACACSSAAATSLPSSGLLPISLPRRRLSRSASPARAGGGGVVAVGPAGSVSRVGMHGLGEVEDLLREVEQLAVLMVLLLHGGPLLVDDHLVLCVGAILTDHHKRRQEDR